MKSSSLLCVRHEQPAVGPLTDMSCMNVGNWWSGLRLSQPKHVSGVQCASLPNMRFLIFWLSTQYCTIARSTVRVRSSVGFERVPALLQYMPTN